MVAQAEMAHVLSQVANWPLDDRVELARKILETVHPPSTRRSRGRSADEVIQLLKSPQPAPNDLECNQILEEELLKR